MITRLLTGTAMAICLALPAAAQDQALDVDSVVATINGEDITLGHMLMVRAGLPEEYQQLPDDVLWDGILNQIVQQQVLSQDDLAEETKRVRLAVDNERRQLLAAEVITKVAEAAITDEAVEAAYQAQYADADQGVEYNASHILVETEEEAQAIADALRAGADFAETAREKSTGPSGPNGGELGWFSDGMMVAPFQDAVATLDVGAISDPVQTQFGWHVIKLNDTRTKEAPELDAVRAQLETEVQQEAVQAYIATLVDSAEITKLSKDEIDPSALSNFELLEN